MRVLLWMAACLLLLLLIVGVGSVMAFVFGEATPAALVVGAVLAVMSFHGLRRIDQPVGRASARRLGHRDHRDGDHGGDRDRRARLDALGHSLRDDCVLALGTSVGPSDVDLVAPVARRRGLGPLWTDNAHESSLHIKAIEVEPSGVGELTSMLREWLRTVDPAFQPAESPSLETLLARATERRP
jgi:hypothetical protein